MKAMRLAMMFVALAAISAESFASMSLSEIRREARFLTDRMGYELGLSNRQYEDVYEINFDFLFQVNEVIDDVVYGYDDAVDYYYYLLDVRNEDLMYVLRSRQYRRFVNRDYFYRPIHMVGNTWRMRIYAKYSDHHYFYFGIPVNYHTYVGAHYRIHHVNSYYAGIYTHALYHGAFRLWGSGYEHRHHDGWHSAGKNKYGHIGSRPWSNSKNYEKSRRDLKSGFVSVPSRDENKRMVSVDSEENHRTSVVSDVRRSSTNNNSKSKSRGSASVDASRNASSSSSSSRSNSGSVSSNRSSSSSVSSNRSSSSASKSSSTKSSSASDNRSNRSSSSVSTSSNRNSSSSVSSNRSSSSASKSSSTKSSSVTSNRSSSSSSASKSASVSSSRSSSSGSSATRSSSSGSSSSRSSSSSSSSRSSGSRR